MAKDLNHWVGIGRLGKDPELKQLSSGKNVLNISIAVNGLKEGEVSWIQVVFWEKLADAVAKYCKKGTRLAVEGRLQVQTWETKEKEKRSTIQVVAENVQFLSAKKVEDGHDDASLPPDMPYEESKDEIPF